jgi:biopolymer transport protein ExbD
MKIKRSKNKPVAETQMISLADIAFLIIFFFLFTSQFMRDKIKVPLPSLPKSLETQSGISIAIDAQKVMHLNGQPVASKEELEGLLKNLLADKKEPAQLEVRLKCDRALTYKDYRPVLEAISNAGGVIAVMHDVKTNQPPAPAPAPGI